MDVKTKFYQDKLKKEGKERYVEKNGLPELAACYHSPELPPQRTTCQGFNQVIQLNAQQPCMKRQREHVKENVWCFCPGPEEGRGRDGM